MLSRATPGPWKAFPTEFCMVGGNGRRVCNLPASICEESTANAELIAAAPDLLDACQAVLMYLTNVNAVGPETVAAKLIGALGKAGVPKDDLDSAAIALMSGACRLV